MAALRRFNYQHLLYKHPAVAAIVQNARQIFLDQAPTHPRPRHSGARRRRYRGARLRAD